MSGISNVFPEPEVASASVFRRILNLLARHRPAVQDGILLAAAVALLALLAFQYDLFANDAGAGGAQHRIDRDEAMLLGAFLSIGLLVFSWRRLVEQRRETAR